MILVLGVWTFLRALIGRSTTVTLENGALLVIILVVATKDGKVIGNPTLEESLTRCRVASGAM